MHLHIYWLSDCICVEEAVLTVLVVTCIHLQWDVYLEVSININHHTTHHAKNENNFHPQLRISHIVKIFPFLF